MDVVDLGRHRRDSRRQVGQRLAVLLHGVGLAAPCLDDRGKTPRQVRSAGGIGGEWL